MAEFKILNMDEIPEIEVLQLEGQISERKEEFQASSDRVENAKAWRT